MEYRGACFLKTEAGSAFCRKKTKENYISYAAFQLLCLSLPCYVVEQRLSSRCSSHTSRLNNQPTLNIKAMTQSITTPEKNGKLEVLRTGTLWKQLYFYQKSDALYQMTFVFCTRFLPPHGDRTVDQMVQAARSGKQNIVEGSEDGKTSTEMELRLLNVARSSLQELRQDYEDYLNTRDLTLWTSSHPRYSPLLEFCRKHNSYSDYKPFVNRWTDEEFCNTAITICHIVDRMMCSYLNRLQKEFVEHGGIKERMYASRTGYRQQQDQLMQSLKAENTELKKDIASLKAEIAALKSKERQKF